MNSAIILCGGSGTRFGNHNKLLATIDGKSVIERSFDMFNNMSEIHNIIIVTKAEDDIISSHFSNYPKVKIVTGGHTRFHSVLNGLRACPHDTDIAIIHDGARPFVTAEIINRSIESAKTFGSGVVAFKSVDTLRTVDGNILKGNVDRECTVKIQTPQSFDYKRILNSYEKAEDCSSGFTDDSSVYTACYGDCHWVEGSDSNIKITHANDINNSVKYAVGYDIHRLVPNRKLYLCGVHVPHDLGLLGHSDADVAIHAIMDSILSALGLKDIGHYFPDTDDSYSGIDSKILLAKVVEICHNGNNRIINCSVSIICEKPRLSPHIDSMRECLATILNIPKNAVGITVTTNEKTGLIGNGEAIACYAVCSVINN